MWSQGERARKINESGGEPGGISEVIASAPPPGWLLALRAAFSIHFVFLSGTSSAYCENERQKRTITTVCMRLCVTLWREKPSMFVYLCKQWLLWYCSSLPQLIIHH